MIRKNVFTRTAPLALTALFVLGSAPAAFADSASDTTPLPVSEPIVPSQNSPEATAEADATKIAAPANLNDLKAKGASQIAKRQRTLNDLAGKLSVQTTDCGSNAAMSAQVASTSTSLAGVGVNLAAATDPVVARTLYKSIFIDHRVYILVAPKAGKVLRCDAQLARSAALTTDGATLQSKIDAAKASGVDTTAAQAIKDSGSALLLTVNPSTALAPIIGLTPDRGVDAVRLSNSAALKGADTSLDASLANQKQVHAQFVAARKLLAPAVAADKKADKKAENEEKKAEKKAEIEAKKAAKAAEKAAKTKK